MDTNELLKKLYNDSSGDLILNLESKVIKLHSLILSQYSEKLITDIKENKFSIPQDMADIFFSKLYNIKEDVKLNLDQLFTVNGIIQKYDITLLKKDNDNNIIDSINFNNILEAIEKINKIPDNITLKNGIINYLFDFFLEYKSLDKNKDQWNDNCYDLLKPGEFTRPENHFYYTCCKHNTISKNLSHNKHHLLHKGLTCCISTLQKKNNDLFPELCTELCCQHRIKQENYIVEAIQNKKILLENNFRKWKLIKKKLEKDILLELASKLVSNSVK